jgi:hypothetical protein
MATMTTAGHAPGEDILAMHRGAPLDMAAMHLQRGSPVLPASARLDRVVRKSRALEDREPLAMSIRELPFASTEHIAI